MTDRAAGSLASRLKRVGIGGGGLGALVTFIAVAFLFPALGGSVRLNNQSGWVNGPVIVVVLVIWAVVYTRIKTRRVEEALRWVREKRAPTDTEHRLTLGLAPHFVKLDAFAWSCSAVIFAVFNGLVFSWRLGAVVAAT